MDLAKRFLMRVNSSIRKNVFYRRTIARVLFDIDVVCPVAVQGYCEWGTIMLRFVMRRYIRSRARVLDVGTGAHAILAVFAKKVYGDVSVLATDILPEIASWARETAVRNGVDVPCVVADMFEGVQGKFDVILCHPPFIPTRVLEELRSARKSLRGVGARRRIASDGGLDGLDVIRSFLKGLGEHLTDQGRAIMCANPIHCGVDRIRPLCESSGLTIERIHRFPGVMNTYVLAARQQQNTERRQRNEGAS